MDNWDKWETGLIDVKYPLVNPDQFPGTVIPVKKPRERYGHMTAKPVDLLQHLIRIFSAPNALILDPFAGSGSTGVAAKRESRPFIGYEIEEEMAVCAQQRIEGDFTMRNLPSPRELQDAWEDVQRIHAQHLASHGVKLPQAIDYRELGRSIQLAVLYYYEGETVDKKPN